MNCCLYFQKFFNELSFFFCQDYFSAVFLCLSYSDLWYFPRILSSLFFNCSGDSCSVDFTAFLTNFVTATAWVRFASMIFTNLLFFPLLSCHTLTLHMNNNTIIVKEYCPCSFLQNSSGNVSCTRDLLWDSSDNVLRVNLTLTGFLVFLPASSRWLAHYTWAYVNSSMH